MLQVKLKLSVTCTYLCFKILNIYLCEVLGGGDEDVKWPQNGFSFLERHCGGLFGIKRLKNNTINFDVLYNIL